MSAEQIGAIFAGIALVVGTILGARQVGKSAANTETTNPDEKLIEIISDVQIRLKKAEESGVVANARATVLEADLKSEQERGRDRDTRITALQKENAEQRGQIGLLRRALEGWEAWHRLLISKWDEYRLRDTPPDAPRLDPTE